MGGINAFHSAADTHFVMGTGKGRDGKSDKNGNRKGGAQRTFEHGSLLLHPTLGSAAIKSHEYHPERLIFYVHCGKTAGQASRLPEEGTAGIR